MPSAEFGAGVLPGFNNKRQAELLIETFMQPVRDQTDFVQHGVCCVGLRDDRKESESPEWKSLGYASDPVMRYAAEKKGLNLKEYHAAAAKPMGIQSVAADRAELQNEVVNSPNQQTKIVLILLTWVQRKRTI